MITAEEKNSKIIIIDDNEAIHRDFAKILENHESSDMVDLEASLFDEVASQKTNLQTFNLASAYQGQEGLEKVYQAVEEKQPFAMAFVDMRMPPGWDGLETIQHLWEIDPDLQVVICTAYSDYSWEDLREKLGPTDRFLILKKPFDNAEVQQLAAALTKKWDLTCRARLKMEDLGHMVQERTEQLTEYANNLETRNQELAQTQQELSSLNSTLEQKVEERTEEVEKLLVHKDQFIGQLGHDLKSPLTPLITLLPIMLKREQDPKQKELLEICQTNTQFMQELVSKTLRIARLDSCKYIPAFEIFNLSNLLNKIIKRESTKAKEKGIGIKPVTNNDITVYAEKLAIQEIVDNLIGNALKFTPKGGTIRLKIKSQSPFATVSITDTGIGMDDEQLPHIFDEFYKADESRHDLQSQGLGLSICKRSVESHGGQIWAESLGQGNGSTLAFTIKLADKAV